MPQLALCGGTPTLPTPLSAPWPLFRAADEEALLRVFRSGQWWRGGTLQAQADSECGRFERAFAAYHDAPYGLACTNGTVALEIALHAAGVQPGDEVIVPALSFVVSASAVLPTGGVPVFVDCDPRTLQPDPDAIQAAITPRTRAIVIVHFGGYPADLDRIVPIAQGHGVALIEDCAHAQGSQWRGQGVGSYGDYGTFSFQQSKALTCGEGGIVLCRSLEHWHRAYRYHNLGRQEEKGFYDFYFESSNCRLTDLQGALLNTQFARLREHVPRKMEAAARLSRGLRQIGGLEPLPDDARITRRGYYFYLLHYDCEAFGGVSRDVFRQAVAAEGVPLWQGYGRAIHEYPLFREWVSRDGSGTRPYGAVSCPAAEHAAGQTLCTLAHQLLLCDADAMEGVVEAVAKVQRHAGELADWARREGRG
ncbi:MAG: DegT/DnrJ/EryC1/StrS family aminotransferase [Candidatus Latescibacterota bacterium]